MLLVVILTVCSEMVDTFRTFEQKAAAVMARYGGAIERTVIVKPESGSAFFQEVHLVAFPDEAAFQAYRQDEALKAIAPLRQASVVKTEILVGEAGPDYGPLT